jgi:uncharacterized protein YjbJ (UPF0337 family)
MPEPDASERSSGLFEKVAAKAKHAVGRLIGDEDLVEEGDLQQARSETEADAARLTAEAEQRQRETEVAAAQEANVVAQERADAELVRLEREEQVERELSTQQAQVDQEFARRQALVDDEARKDEQAIEQDERLIVAARIDGAVKAVDISQEAKEAEAAAAARDTARRQLERQQTGE